MTRMHINLKVKDLTASVGFYSRFFGSEPTVLKPEYAKWMLDDPRVNFAVGLSSESAGLEHLGIEAESRDELASLRRRLADTGGSIREEGETACCYAQSDKSWVNDGQGVIWEVFYTHGSADTYYVGPQDAPAEPQGEGCCAPDCCDTGEEAHPS